MVDPWSREPVAQEFPYRADNGLTRLVDIVKDQADRMRELTSNLLSTAGIRLTQAGMTISKALTVDGNLDVTGTAAFSGNTTIGGNAAITGTLSLPAGIIDNAALANPIAAQQIFFYTQNFAITAAGGTYASQTITVPAGFTKAVVAVTSRLYGINSTAGLDRLSCVTKIAGSGGFSFQFTVNSGDAGFNVSPFSTILTGLTPGGTFLLEVRGNTQVANWAASPINTAEMNGSILWFR